MGQSQPPSNRFVATFIAIAHAFYLSSQAVRANGKDASSARTDPRIGLPQSLFERSCRSPAKQRVRFLYVAQP